MIRSVLKYYVVVNNVAPFIVSHCNYIERDFDVVYLFIG